MDAPYDTKKEDGTAVFNVRGHNKLPSRQQPTSRPASNMNTRAKRPLSEVSEDEKERRAKFQKTKQKDRNAVKSHIDNLTRNNAKFQKFSARDRWFFIKTERQKKLDQRLRKGNETTAQAYPDLHDERKELDLLRRRYQAVLDGLDEDLEDAEDAAPATSQSGTHGRKAEDEDDEEPSLPIKTEPLGHTNAEFDRQVREYAAVPTYTMTSASTLTTLPTLDMAALRVLPNKVISRTLNEARMATESHGLKYESGAQAGRRRWQVVDGRLMEEPPFEHDGDDATNELQQIFDQYEREREAEKMKLEM